MVGTSQVRMTSIYNFSRNTEGNRPLVIYWRKWKVNIKLDRKEIERLDSSSLVYYPVAGSCGHINPTLCPIKGRTFLII
jgi:hypothetical protein